MKKSLFTLIILILSFLAFSINFSKSNEGYYEIPSYKPFLGVEFSNELFDKNMPFLLANLEYNGKFYYMPYTKYLYKNNEVFVIGVIERNDDYEYNNFKIYSTNHIINTFSKEIKEANISIIILYKNVSLHGKKISQESTNLNLQDFSFIINDTLPREIYSLDNSVFEKYYKEEMPKDNYIYYKVKSGDTLYSISRIFGVSIDYLLKINNIKSPELLKDDMFIIVGTSKNFISKGEANE
ncbi:LysM domain-containing protein [Marinitoga hydrogenitolerans DSM 16785]|uniref:LysM domain-containing protein n=1 Tax=Marinitoga hydrogenitolerans (strain DSM 16785 / JCM 12826 / AT1271) TaxID=1122195 RepID=A0A1M4UYL6_MARH1|nr:LysM peptidoglycan-binding domain-containing protein [Marinitoga hydrogenitolerans]SHE61740.1 LysM domain-containing protein [Marinitoga hydrogenitolerans DSM 16785]